MKTKRPTGYERRIKPPYSIKYVADSFVLYKGKKLIQVLKAESENGADREACAFLGYPPTSL